jgi:hypothetical protein
MQFYESIREVSLGMGTRMLVFCCVLVLFIAAGSIWSSTLQNEPAPALWNGSSGSVTDIESGMALNTPPDVHINTALIF